MSSSISFDATITSLYSPLLAGKCVTMLREGMEYDLLGAQLSGDYSVIKITPAHLELLRLAVMERPTRVCPKTFVIGGDILSADSVRFWMNYAPETTLINEYGPTEATVGCCVHTVTSKDITAGLIPIGRPLANVQLYILDAYGQPVPVGVAGELYIGGTGLSRGYLRNPELTATKFITSPFGGKQDDRLYRTGDLARYLTDGSILFLGRRDNQIKVRGFRIEIGEIECVLTQHPQVEQAVVVATSDENVGKSLTAYVVLREKAGLEPNLREFLCGRLPGYMIPSAFVLLDDLPLTSNGKIEIRSLRVPKKGPVAQGRRKTPSDSIESMIKSVWEDVLHLEEIGMDDNFFDLGGHSILAAQMRYRLTQDVKLTVSILDILQYPTIKSLAAHIRRRHSERSDNQRVVDRATNYRNALSRMKRRAIRPDASDSGGV